MSWFESLWNVVRPGIEALPIIAIAGGLAAWLGHRNINMSYSVYLDHQKIDDYEIAS
jgi:hypothetical protein